MTPDEPRRRTGIDRIIDQFAELSVKLDQLLEGYERTLTALKGDGRAAKQITNLSGGLKGFREEVIFGKTYRVFSSKRVKR